MSSLLLKNVGANFLGKSWSTFMGLFFIPIYIRFLGIETYALIGFFGLLSTLIAPFDSAIGFTLNRELARMNSKENSSLEIRDFLRSFEVIFWAFSFLIGLTIFFVSHFLAVHWVKPLTLSLNEVSHAIALMGIALVLQWPISFYSNGLIGLQRQVIINVVLIIMSTLRSVGAVILLCSVAPSITIFFLWQIFISLFHVIFIACILWRALPKSSNSAKFKVSHLIQFSPFAFRSGFLAILSLFLIHGDKMMISKLASLDQYGYYTLAASIAGSLYFIISPMFSAVFPKYCETVANASKEELKEFYYKTSQLLALLILPVASILLFFSKELLFFWTHNVLITEKTYQVVVILCLGTICNGLMNMPFALQLAFGWMRLALIQNIISIIILLPSTMILFHYYGLMGAAWSWLLHNFGCILICLPIIHKKLLQIGPRKWLWECFLLPLSAASLISFCGFMCKSFITNSLFLFGFIVVIFLLSFLFTALATPVSREYIKKNLSKKFSRNYSE